MFALKSLVVADHVIAVIADVRPHHLCGNRTVIGNIDRFCNVMTKSDNDFLDTGARPACKRSCHQGMLELITGKSERMLLE